MLRVSKKISYREVHGRKMQARVVKKGIKIKKPTLQKIL